MVGGERPMTADSMRFLSPSFFAARMVALVSAALSRAGTSKLRALLGEQERKCSGIFSSMISQGIIYDVYFYWKRILESGRGSGATLCREFLYQNQCVTPA